MRRSTVRDVMTTSVRGRSDLLEVFARPDAEIREEVADEVFGRMLLVDPRHPQYMSRTDLRSRRGVGGISAARVAGQPMRSTI